MTMNEAQLATLSQYSLYFRGNQTTHGRFIPPNGRTEEGKKVEGDSFTIKEPVTTEKYRDHLMGKTGLGVVPIDNNNNVRFCVIDVDDYKIDVAVYLRVIEEFKLPFCVFKSKSGGIHMYTFFSEDVKASDAIDMMRVWLSIFGLPAKTEIFPKQRVLKNGEGGNWINLPYFGKTRQMLDSTGKGISLQEALLKIQTKLVNKAEFNLILNNLPISDGPPCLQSLYMKNDPLLAELYLFNLAVYYKAKFPDTWQAEIAAANDRMDDPLPDKRVDVQVINAHDKNDYFYKCKEEPICSRCNEEICRRREFGKAGDQISNLSFEQLTQVLTDPPHYKWVINGKDMLFYSESELRNQDRFGDLCIRNLHICPNRLKAFKWNAILNKALTGIETEEVDSMNDVSPGAILGSYVHEFLTRRRGTVRRERMMEDDRLVFFDEKKGWFYFRKNGIMRFLTAKNFRHFQGSEIFNRLRDMGAKDTNMTMSGGKKMRAWKIPLEAVEKLGEDFGDIETVTDFSQYKEETF